jgi:hypothetical protein
VVRVGSPGRRIGPVPCGRQRPRRADRAHEGGRIPAICPARLPGRAECHRPARYKRPTRSYQGKARAGSTGMAARAILLALR